MQLDRGQKPEKILQIRQIKTTGFILFTVLLLLVTKIRSSDLGGHPWKCHIIDDSSKGADGVKPADINGDGFIDIATGWEGEGITRVYLNPGIAESTLRWPAVTVGKTPSVEDAVFADLDGDGFTDVVSCCEGETKTIFVHWAPENQADLLIAGKWKQAILDVSNHAQQWMFAWPMQVDDKNGIDLVAGSKGKNAQIGWFEAPAQERTLSHYKWHSISQAGWIMSIWKQDMDADGDTDIVISDRRGALKGCRWLENPGYGPAVTKPWKNHFMGAETEEVLSMCLADINEDGLQDAVVAVRDMKILVLRRIDKGGLRWTTHEIPVMFNNGNPRAVVVADVDQDGQKDLVLTTWNAENKHGVLWLEYEKGPFDKEWLPREISGTEKGIKYDRIEMVDLDGDGDSDLLTCEEQQGGDGMGVFWYENPFGKANESRCDSATGANNE